MAAEDIRIQRRLPVAASYRDAAAGEGDRSRTQDRRNVVVSALRHRWLTLAVIALVSGVVAFGVASQFSTRTTVSTSQLVYSSLPVAPGPNLPTAMTPDTCVELVSSVSVLQELCTKRNLAIAPADLALLLKTQAPRGSQLLTVTLTWAGGASDMEGAEILNDLLDVFIEQIAADRRETTRRHRVHAETSLLEARADLEKARQLVETQKLQLQQQLDQNGYGGEQQRILLTGISEAEGRIAEKQAEKAAIEQQIQLFDKRMTDAPQSTEDDSRAMKAALVRDVNLSIELLRAPCAEGSPSYQQFTDLAARVVAFAEKKDAPSDLDRWFAGLLQVLQQDRAAVSGPIVTKVTEAYTKYQPAKVSMDQSKLVAQQRQVLEFSLIAVEKHLAMLDRRLSNNRVKLKEIAKPSLIAAEQAVYEAEQRLKDAETKTQNLTIRSASLHELETCRAREWAARTPASAETTELRTNQKKLFVLAFGLCGMLLSLPVLGLEWMRQRSCQVEFIRSLELPILADRVLEHFLPQRRQPAVAVLLSHEDQESLRMLALRIQQSVHRSGAVVLFTSLDAQTSVAPLMAAVAECLAAREERVLILDAVSPEKAPLRLVDIAAAGRASKAGDANGDANGNANGDANGNANGGPTTVAASAPGLSEFLCDEERRDVRSLIRPTGCPGVDFIGSGQGAFPREAMASSYLTHLLDTCRKDYSMILVNGPSTRYAADVEMLAARADGVIVAANSRVKHDERAASVLKDLVDLGAPIIGVVV